MSGKSAILTILGSIVGSVAIMTVLSIFVLPMIFPVLSGEGVVLQTKYGEFNSPAYIFDDGLTYQKMPDTELNFTISEGSKISATFSAMALMSLGPTFTARSSYNISLVIEGVVNRTLMVIYFDNSPAGGFYREMSYNLYMNLVSAPLAAGKYTISVYWMSEIDAPGTNSLSVAHNPPVYNYTRTLYLQELKV
ncbi:MAG: hypothetical protein ACXABG_05400 [Promethearchaeota archaeon]|jgi:hypothetical protein